MTRHRPVLSASGIALLFASAAAVWAVLAGVLGLLGWIFDSSLLKGGLPTWPTMKANTAIGFVLGGFALAMVRRTPVSTVSRLGASVASGVIVLLAVATLIEYAAGVNLGIDELVFRDAGTAAGVAHPERMSASTAFCFCLTGAALLLVDLATARGWRPGHLLVLASMLVAYVALMGYVFDVRSLVSFGPFSSMSLPTVLTFLVLNCGILCARPEVGWMRALLGDGAAGLMMRQLLPAAILLPPFFGWLRWLGQEAGWYDTASGLALSTSTNVIVFCAVVAWSARRLEWGETAKRETESALGRSRQLLQAIVQNSRAVIYVKDLTGRYLMANPRFCELFHFQAEQVLGRTDHEIFPAEAAAAFRAMDQRVAGAGVALTEEEMAPHDDGPHTYVSVKCPLQDEHGQPYAIFGISTDITDFKRSEEAARASEERMRLVVETALDAVISIDSDGFVKGWNPQAETTFGWTRPEAVGHSLADLIVPEHYREAHRHGLKSFLATGEGPVLNRRVELSALHRDGREFPIELAITPIRAGAVVSFSAFVRDITDRKRAEHALRESEERFRTMADSAPVLIWVAATDKLCTWFNQRWLEFVGRTMEQEIGNGWAESVHSEDFDRCLQTYTTNFDARKPFSMEYRLRRHDGDWRWILDNGTPCHDPEGRFTGYIGSCIDITENRRSIEALRESQERFQTLAESLPHLVWTCRPDGYCDYLSRQWVEYTGRPAEEQFGSGWAEHLHPEDRHRVQAAWAEASERGDRFDVEFRIRRGADGAYRWFKTRAVPLRDANGQIVKWFGSNTDFDDNKRAEQHLQTQLGRLDLLHSITRAIGERQDLRSIFQVVVRRLEEDLPIDFGCIGLYEQSTETITITSVGACSEALARDLAMTEQARIRIDQNGLSRCVRGKLVYEPDLGAVHFPFPQRLLAGGLRSLVAAPLLVESNVFGVLVAARREPRSFSSSDCEFLRQLSEHVALASHQAQIYAALQQAYDDLRQSQQAVMQQERLRALGQMASGIAHDINNAISPIGLYAGLIQQREPNLSPQSRQSLEVIERAVDDVAATVGRLREFYRQREPQLMLVPLEMNRLVQQVLELTRARWSDMPQQRGVVIEAECDLEPDLPVVMGVESEIREALTNLVFNAVDAMPEGGRLVLRTRSQHTASGSDGPAAAQHVRIEVADTGVGMDEDTRRRCLEPFFTTKGERGTGLGLAMVYGVVQRHSADIEIESEPGAGSTVRLIFAVPVMAAATPSLAEPVSAISKRFRVLVIDDDPLLLKSVRDTFEADGHLVISANGGRAGIDAFEAALKKGPAFDVVVTDLGMPYVDGRMVASAVKMASPTTPVIMLTGWGQRLVVEGDIPPHVDAVLSKPPKFRELREALARYGEHRKS